MNLREYLGTTVKHDGDEWKIVGIGALVDDAVFCHLASTTRGTTQKNGWCPSQTADFIKIEKLVKE